MTVTTTAEATLRERLMCDGADLSASANIAHHLADGDLDRMEREVEGHIRAALDAMAIDTSGGDPNTTDTAARVARMWIREIFAGRYQPGPAITSFPNARQLDQCYAVGPIAVRSACAHHLVPIVGQAWVGVIPGERVIGLSKFHRLVAWIMARPHIQEDATEQIADAIATAADEPAGLAVVVRARHFCCGWRGVKDDASLMVTSVMRGALRTSDAARAEFFSLIRGMGY